MYTRQRECTVTAPHPGKGDISTAPALLFSLRCVILLGRKLLLHKLRGGNEHTAATERALGRVPAACVRKLLFVFLQSAISSSVGGASYSALSEFFCARPPAAC